jgi:transglutaminase-like putative cysteine protease
VNPVPALERIATFFHLPHAPYDPAAEVAQEGPGAWRWLCLATWLMMSASLVATWALSPQPWLVIEMATLLLAALPVAYRLHFRTTSRLLVNWLTFSSALLLGLVQLRYLWPLSDGVIAANDSDALTFLVVCFMWVTVFRAFTLRTLTDLVQTILPCGSIILLTLLFHPVPVVMACAALVVFGTLALLAAEHRVRCGRACQAVASISRTHGLRRTGALYSWPTLYGLVLLAAVLVAWMAARAELSGGWGEVARTALARGIYQFVRPNEVAAIPDYTVVLARLTSWPDRDVPVFTAHTVQPGNWRVTCYHDYDGQRWQRGRPGLIRCREEAGWNQVPLAGSGASRQGATRVTQRITAAKYLMGSVPALFCPEQVRVVQGTVRYDRDRCVQIADWVHPGASYEVVSDCPPVVAVRRPGVEVPAAALAVDTGLPDDLPVRVRELARQLAQGQPTPYLQARAIEQYLVWGFQYNLEPETNWPDDFVDHFLFVSKQGFCHHFAGSMVILCRCLGLPARLASGYLQGEAAKDDPDTYTVREKDAHVWPEVYLAGSGWVAFEPTPPEPEARRPLSDAWKAMSQVTVVGAQQAWQAVQRSWPSAVALLSGLSLLAVAWRGRRARRLFGAPGERPEVWRVVRAYLLMRQALAHHGAAMHPHLAPREALDLLPASLDPVRSAALVLTDRYLEARFGRRQVTTADAEHLETLLGQIRQGLRRGRHRPGGVGAR